MMEATDNPSGGSGRRTASLTVTQILLLNSVVCGVEICACAGFTYIPPMLLKVGYSEETMSFILGLGPLLGFVIVPVLGRASDHCHSFYGRRRPFIFALSMLLLVSLYMIPFGEYFMTVIFGYSHLSKVLGMWCLTLGSVLLDFTSQACLTPCEALLNDASMDTGQHERVFSIYSSMVSLGGVFGYLLTAIDWKSNSLGVYFGSQEASIFSILIVVFTILLAATLIVAEERPLSSLGRQNSLSDMEGSFGNSKAQESGYSSSSSEDVPSSILSNHKANLQTSSPLRSEWRSRASQTRSKLRSVIFGFFTRGRFLSSVCDCFRLVSCGIFSLLPQQLKQVFDVPIVLRYLTIAHFCSWTALMGFNLYFTDFVGQAVYNGNPNAPEGSPNENLYDEGVRMGSWGLLLHCITSASYAFFIEKLVDKYGSQLTYLVGMSSFCFAMMGMVLFRNVYIVNIMAAFTGFAYATVTTIPFILVSKYHIDKEIYFFDVMSSNGQSLSARGIATDMAVLDSAYFLSQVVLATAMGYIVHITGTVYAYMVCAGVMGLLACFFIQKVIISKSDVRALQMGERQHSIFS
ncbi:solute carrier family 45 member 3-like [Haliotis rubra]|uniref:solute carrier family 45 member 3-like n=1 Tax=Haliotis rubra TaxID=36100 RepID=UPI001EE529C2|nr:solute carrier family 45 member 3-like [Haliotis rubra]